jgi:hypothetical protein
MKTTMRSPGSPVALPKPRSSQRPVVPLTVNVRAASSVTTLVGPGSSGSLSPTSTAGNSSAGSRSASRWGGSPDALGRHHRQGSLESFTSKIKLPSSPLRFFSKKASQSTESLASSLTACSPTSPHKPKSLFGSLLRRRPSVDSLGKHSCQSCDDDCTSRHKLSRPVMPQWASKTTLIATPPASPSPRVSVFDIGIPSAVPLRDIVSRGGVVAVKRRANFAEGSQSGMRLRLVSRIRVSDRSLMVFAPARNGMPTSCICSRVCGRRSSRHAPKMSAVYSTSAATSTHGR